MTEAIKEKLTELAATLMVLGNVIGELAKGRETEEVKVEEPKAEEPKTEESKVEEVKVEGPKAEEPKTEKPKEEYKMEDVRKALGEKSGAGFTEQIRELLKKHGGSRLSEVPKEEYAAIMEEVKEIGCSQ